MSALRVAPLLLLATAACPGSGREVGRTSFFGSEVHEIGLALGAGGVAHFDTAIDVLVPSTGGDPDIHDEWRYTIEVVRADAVVRTTTCDAFDLGPGASSTQTGDAYRLSRSRLLGCAIPLDAGVSTLRMTLAPNRAVSGVTPVKVDVFVMM